MELEIIDNTVITSAAGRIGVPSIGLNHKTGLMSMNKTGLDTIKWSEGDKILVCRDKSEDPDNEWYIYTTKSDKGLNFRPKKDKSEAIVGIQFNSTELVRRILKSADMEDENVTYRIGAIPTQHAPVGGGRCYRAVSDIHI